MSTRNLPGGKGRPARKADNFTAICEQIFKRKCGSLDDSQPNGPSRRVTGRVLPFYTKRARKENTELEYTVQQDAAIYYKDL
jgi:hypothetical protein